ncbi:MAG: amidase [Devosia sp.]|nr:amidase [Devosia sp.]
MLANNDIPFASLTEISAGLKSGALSSLAVTETMLARIAAIDPQLNSYIKVTAEEAIAAAKAADAEIAAGRYRGLLHGVPIAIKDLFYTAGTPATFGSGAYLDFRANYTATVVERLLTSGAVLLGRLHLHEGAYGDHHPKFGRPTHPYHKDYWPGGSSSGSGVATAAGLCFASLGSDTGGSIRFPSGLNGLTGVKPTWGRVSRYGVFTLADSLDTVGPMARSAADAAAVFDVIAGYDANDSTSLAAPVPNYSAALEGGVFGARGMKIGIDWSYLGDDTHPEIIAAIKEALRVFEALGAIVTPVTVPDVLAVSASQPIIMETECANFHRELFLADRSGFGDLLSKAIERGLTYDPVKLANAYIVRDKFKGELLKTFTQVDAIVAPVMPRLGIRYDDMDSLFNDLPGSLRFTGPFNMSGSPTVTFPTGMSSIGLPLAMQLIGPHLSEAALLKAVHAFQQATAFHLQRPSLH